MINKDKLEQFIIESRSAFDDKEVPPLAWEKIQGALERDNKKPRRVSLWQLTRIAAAIIFLLAAGILIGRQTSDKEELAYVEEQYPEFADAQVYFEMEVDERLARLANYSYDASLESDMIELDLFMEELKAELEIAPKGSEPKIIQAMIHNYQAKLDILERVLESVENTPAQSVNSHKNDSDI